MKSRITIEVDFDNGNLPIIKVIQQQSSDVRDSLVQSFLQSLQHTSRWCRIEYKGEHPVSSEGGKEDASYRHVYYITPIVPSDLQTEIDLMKAVLPPVKG